jgi:hypothetical protein
MVSGAAVAALGIHNPVNSERELVKIWLNSPTGEDGYIRLDFILLENVVPFY